MDSGYYAACAGLKAQTQALDLIANNLANVSTGGYRGQSPTFAALMTNGVHQAAGELNRVLNSFNLIGGTHLDLATGQIQPTGNPLDLAIQGDSFFAVQTRKGTLYTRAGSFHLSPNRELVSAEGHQILGESGPLVLPPGNISVSADGTVSVNGAIAGKLKLVGFADSTELSPAGGAYYLARAGAERATTSAAVQQGMLEGSNVSAVETMASLIAVQRHAEMMQRAMAAFYTEFNRVAAEQLARV